MSSESTKPSQADNRTKARNILVQKGGLALASAGNYSQRLSDEEIGHILRMEDANPGKLYDVLIAFEDRLAAERRDKAIAEQTALKQRAAEPVEHQPAKQSDETPAKPVKKPPAKKTPAKKTPAK